MSFVFVKKEWWGVSEVVEEGMVGLIEICVFLSLLPRFLEWNEFYLPKGVLPHEPTLVYEALDAIYVSLSCILPDGDVTLVVENGFIVGVLRNHQLIVVKPTKEVAVIEVCASVDERLLMVVVFNQGKEFEERVAERLVGETCFCLYVDERNEVLLFWEALRDEVLQLQELRSLCPIEMVGAYFQSVFPCSKDVVLVAFVYSVSPFGSLYVYVCVTSVVTDCFPEHLALIVADVYSVYMCASILTLNDFPLCEGFASREEEYDDICYFSIHTAKLQFFSQKRVRKNIFSPLLS